ncbi:tonsoku-like protein [Parasteatoda tepidariorum]|uniref:tonsoku-like protein n=1 Tax=Parasteatoda tepidariorum TaxID=114398 RepID=UPI00077FD815|nr:tonsoku-like protein [Parasteatoda tepidariorum]XP_042904912.1 tonsoku-like protein [Parasteatoda tepidariorum]
MNEIKQLEREKNKAVAQGKWKEAGEYSNCIGATLFDEGSFEEALRSHQEELEFNKMIQDALGMAVAHRKIGECYAALSNFKKALHHVNFFLNLSKSIKSVVEEQRAWATLGRTYYMKYKNETDPEIVKKTRDLSEKAYMCALRLLEKTRSELTAQEFAQAKSRILLNVGLLFEEHNLTKCAEHIRLAIYLASKYDLYEDLNRCQYTLGDVYRKHEQYSQSLKLLDGAIETAERLHNKTLLCDALVLKANVLLSLHDFEGAKQCYKKAYKICYPNKDEHEKVERWLKTCTGLCITLKELEDSDECRERKQLFEKIADGLSSLECHKQALHYYQKTLKCLEELNCAEIEKAPIYFSIAETYYDLEENDKAIEYFNMDLQCNENKPQEQVKTLWKMAELYEEKQEISNCEKLLVKAASLVEAAGIDRLFLKALERLAYFYEKNSMLEKLEDIKVKLQNPKYDDLSSDEECEAEASENPFDNVIISESEKEEEETNSKLYPRRQRQRKKLTNKTNEKGETPLHKACIEGDLTYAKMLLESGVNVNATDNGGWTPLHEACNYGHYAVVEYLLEKRASINPRSGTECGGITPLHDACRNGHLNVVQLLLSRGACPTILSDDGRSALDLLLEWKRNDAHLDKVSLKQCDSIEEQLKSKMKQAGQDVKIKDAYSCEKTDVIPDFYGLPVSQHSRLSDKQSQSPSTSSEDDLSDEDEKICDPPSPRKSKTLKRAYESSDPQEGASEYKSVISSLRRSAVTISKKILSEAKTIVHPALVNEEDIVDEWLIDDTSNQPKAKKRKTFSLNVSKSKSVTQYSKTKDNLSNDLISDFGDFPMEDFSSNQQSEHREQKVVQHETLHNNSDRNLNGNSNLPFNLRVKICDKLIFVPILEENTCVRDLAEQAAQRYRDIFANEPVLRLTKLGALLGDSDIVKNLFVNNEEVTAFVESWVEQSMEESYVQVCKKHKSVPLNDITKELSKCDKEIKLPNCLIPPLHINLLFSAISHCSKLQCLNVSRVMLTDSGFDHLISCFPSFVNLIILKINCCCLTFESVKKMSNYLTQEKEYSKKLPKLEILDLGNNLLSSKCSDYLVSILRLPSLTTICLNSCNLDSHLFENSKVCASLKTCEKLEELNISGNNLGYEGVAKIFSCLPMKNLKKLNLSHTSSEPVKMGLQISKFLCCEFCSLKELILEGCHLRDTDLSMLSKYLHCPDLQLLNISLNPSLSAKAICIFLKSGFFKNNQLVDVIITGTCRWDIKNVAILSDVLKLKTLKHISLDSIPESSQQDLFKVWGEIHFDEAVCLSLPSLFCELKLK